MVALQDVCISISDGDHNAPPKTINVDSVPFVTISDMQPEYGDFDYSGASRVPVAYYDRLAEIRKPKKGDVVYSVVGSFGIPILVKNNDPFVFQRHIAILRPNNDLILSEYLYYLMRSRSFFAWADSAAIGAAQRTITLSALRNKQIALPSLEDQANIVTKLRPYDSLIENNRKQIKLLEEAAQRLYKEWFIDLRFPGHEMTEINPETGLPEGWINRRLYEVVDITRGVAYTSDTLSADRGKRLLNLGNLMPFGGFRDGYEKYYLGKYDNRHILSGGDVVLGLTEQAEGLAGYAARIPSYLDSSLFSADLALLQPRRISSEYLYSSLRYGNLSRALSPFASGAKIKHLKPDHLRGVEIIVADDATVKSFSGIVRMLLTKQDACRQAMSKLCEARDRLLPKLMSGELEV